MTDRNRGLVVATIATLTMLVLTLVGCGLCPEPTPCPACPPTAVPTATPTTAATPAPVLWDGRLSDLGLYVLDMPGTWDLEAAWLTVNGDWATAPQWAKDRYPWANLGGDHHAYGIAYDKKGAVLSGAGFVLQWPDGADQRTPEQCGDLLWANFPLYAGYDWSVTSGPYTWYKYGGDHLVGLGLAYPPLPWQGAGDAAVAGGVHISFFGVWRETG